MKLKNSDILALTQSLTSVDAYKFGTNASLALSKNLRLIKGPYSDLQEQEAKIRKDPSLNFQEEWKKVIEAESEDVPFVTVKKAELDLEKNNMPVSVLAGLYPIISDLED